MSNRYGRRASALGGLFVAIPLAAAAFGFAFGALDWATRSAFGQESGEVAEAKCRHGDNCEEKALRLQAREVAAAEFSARLALLQSIMNFVGVAAVGVTIYYAHRAWKEAQRSANAAHDTLEDARADAAEQTKRFATQLAIATEAANAATKQADIAEDNAWKQLRAYVYAESLTFQWSSDGYPIFTITLRNAGTTPAINIRQGAAWQTGGMDFWPVASADVKVARGRVLGGGISDDIILYVDRVQEIKKETISSEELLYVFGRIEYDDIFGVTYQTCFTFFTGSEKQPASGMSVMSGLPAPFQIIRRAEQPKEKQPDHRPSPQQMT